jgi:hypothetical protein
VSGIRFRGRLPRSSVAIVARSLRKRGKGVAVSSLMIGAGVIFLALGSLQLFKDNSEGSFQWLMLAFVFVSVGIGQRWSENRASRRTIAGQEFRGTVTAEGVTVEEPTAQTLFRWPAFASLERHGDLVIAWLASGSAVPLTSDMFESQAAHQAAYALLVSNISDRGELADVRR